jgi:hypothetical protein
MGGWRGDRLDSSLPTAPEQLSFCDAIGHSLSSDSVHANEGGKNAAVMLGTAEQ